MPAARHFLDWKQPVLASAAEFLVSRYVQDGVLDLDRVVTIVPGRRAGQRLLELLMEVTATESLAFLPPHVVTGGALPELLYESTRPPASDIAAQLAWVRALRETPADIARQLSPRLPDDDATGQWQHLADIVRRLHRELAADGLGFADVAANRGGDGEYSEPARWQALDAIASRYLAILDELELCDQQTARRVAVRENACRTDRDLVLVGMADMSGVLRQMLTAVADRVTLLVAAPESYAARFDELGCLIPAAWHDAALDIRDEQIVLAEDAADQAEAVVDALAEFGPRYAAEQITIGVPDERLVPHVERAVEEHGLTGRWFVGKRLPETRPYLLLVALRDYLRRQTASEFAALVRHPDIDTWLAASGVSRRWIDQLDNYLANHLPVRLGDRWLGESDHRDQLERAHQRITALVGELSDGRQRPIRDWAEHITQLLAQVYEPAAAAAPGAPLTADACQLVADHLQRLGAVPERIAPATTAAEAIGVLLGQLATENVPAAADPDAIEILGWLELPLDDAPALVVTSFNERFVPKATSGDLFLPDSLRRRLDLDDNRRRYARDAYALEVLLHTRAELRLVVARRDTDGNPLAPSRLLFTTDGNTIAERVLRMYDRRSAAQRQVAGGRFVSTRDTSDFTIPIPGNVSDSEFRIPNSEFEMLRVTDFARYLACPYRYYLQRVLRLETLDDRATELDALQFGGLLHDVLGDFGTSDVKQSHNAEEIDQFLQQRLQAHVGGKYGSERMPAVNVQVRQIAQRLRAFARWQAGWAAEGWEIKHVEQPADDKPVPLDVDGRPIALTGRIDRIDQHADGRWVIFDYKSSAQGASPQETHRTRKVGGDWIDLQLPLYIHTAAPLGVTGDISLGYIVLPEDTLKTGSRIAEWNHAELAEADEVARDVVRRIRRGEFWPPADLPPHRDDDFAAIAMVGVFEQPVATTEVQP